MRIVTLAASLIILLTVSVRGEEITTDQKNFRKRSRGHYEKFLRDRADVAYNPDS
jgi:hypothetical protein